MWNKNMEQTKKQLEETIVKLGMVNDQWSERDGQRKREFAKAFGWYDHDRYANDKEPQKPSWEEIFVKLGKLLNGQQNLDTIQDIQSLKVGINQIREQMMPQEEKFQDTGEE